MVCNTFQGDIHPKITSDLAQTLKLVGSGGVGWHRGTDGPKWVDWERKMVWTGPEQSAYGSKGDVPLLFWTWLVLLQNVSIHKRCGTEWGAKSDQGDLKQASNWARAQGKARTCLDTGHGVVYQWINNVTYKQFPPSFQNFSSVFSSWWDLWHFVNSEHQCDKGGRAKKKKMVSG